MEQLAYAVLVAPPTPRTVPEPFWEGRCHPDDVDELVPQADGDARAAKNPSTMFKLDLQGTSTTPPPPAWAVVKALIARVPQVEVHFDGGEFRYTLTLLHDGVPVFFQVREDGAKIGTSIAEIVGPQRVPTEVWASRGARCRAAFTLAQKAWRDALAMTGGR
jgi:hypothetical protein